MYSKIPNQDLRTPLNLFFKQNPSHLSHFSDGQMHLTHRKYSQMNGFQWRTTYIKLCAVLTLLTDSQNPTENWK